MKVLCIEWLFTHNKKIAYICRNYILAKKLYKDLIQYIPQDCIKQANGTDLTIESIFGSSITFFSAESGASLRGLTFHYLILDEFAFFKQEQTDGTNLWNDILFPTIKVNGILTVFVSTPLGKNNLFHTMYLRGLDESYPTYHSILKDIYADGLIDNEGIEEIKKNIPELSFEQEFLCKFLDSSLTFFRGFEHCFHPISHKYNKTWIGVDLSANGSDNTVVAKINELNEVETIIINGTLDQKYKQIADIINTSNNVQAVYIESNNIGTPVINEISKIVKNKSIIHPWLTSNSSKEEIISDMAVKIANKEITFDINDNILYSELSTFICKYSKTNKLQFEAQSGSHDDTVMATAIAIKCKEDFKYTNNITFAKRNIAKQLR